MILKNIKKCFAIIATSAFIFQGCDELDNDQLPATEITDFESENFVSAGSMAIIDVSSGIESSETVNLNIVSSPNFGSLQRLDGALLKYLPNQSFNEGRDFFNIEIKSDKNELLAVKTVGITVNPDSVDLPCTLVAFADFASTGIDDPVLIDVLKNDWDCDDVPIDPASLTLTYEPTNGEASVIDSKIQYVPNPSFSGQDELAYSISSINGEVTSHAMVQLLVGADSIGNCIVQLIDDPVSLGKGGESIIINALENDILCGRPIQSVSISVQPQFGEASVINDDSAGTFLEYRLIQKDASGSDSFTYQVCDDIGCYQATVLVELNDCPLRAVPDYFVLNAESSFDNDYELDILKNDEYCITDSLQVRIISNPSKGSATIENLKLIYTSNSDGQYTDSLVYEICQGAYPCDSAGVLIEVQ